MALATLSGGNRRVKTTIILTIVACACGLLPAAEVEPIHKLSKAELEARLEGDSRAAQVQRPGLRSVISYMESRPDLFPANQPRQQRVEPAHNLGDFLRTR